MSDQRAVVAPVAIGIGLTIMFLAVLAYLTSRRRAQEPQTVPALAVISPTAHSVIDSPLIVRLSADRPLVLKPSGWGAGRLHIHATVNGVQYMPAAADIQAEDSATFTWILRDVKRGPVRIRLGWADGAHRELEKGQTSETEAVLR